MPESEALQTCASRTDGLTGLEAASRLAQYGANEVETERPVRWPTRLFRAIRNPLVVLLSALAALSLATGDAQSAAVMGVMVALGVGLRLTQETRADHAAEALKAMIHVTATVLRDGQPHEIPLREVVPGDVVLLSAGDMVPGDARVLAAKDLFLNQSALTGESLPTEKIPVAPADRLAGVSDRADLCFLGSSVQSGTGRAVIVETGRKTLFGTMVEGLAGRVPPTAFDRGITRFTWLMIGFMSVMVPLVFVINGVTKHDWREAFFFALAVAVGLTPEMLPTIVSVCLSRGAVAMSKEKVIVKRLNAIQNLGAMDILCTDKTGTLTMDSIVLERYCDPEGKVSDDVLRDALLISHLETGLKSALDTAVLQHLPRHPELGVERYTKVDEIPFDFTRKLMSVVVRDPRGARRLLAKGAPEEVLSRCTQFIDGGNVRSADASLAPRVRAQYESLSSDGFRVLAVAYRDVPEKPAYGREDECDLVLAGYIAFLDPPKETALAAVTALQASGVAVKILTGDNELVTNAICARVGLHVVGVRLGREIAAMSDAELEATAEGTTVFARLSPTDKERIMRALQARKHVVGFMGDGINDAAALRVADVGISVDTGVDVAKDAAAIVLLEKSLLVLRDGILQGRKVFANIVKYIRMGASSNFGNMFSVLGASALLPFVPMTPKQVLTNNLLYDFSQVPIPTDNVDPEQTAKPRPWDIAGIGRYILLIGPLSSIFDYTTYAMMWYLFGATTPARAVLFQTGWFVESLMTQTLIIHVIRTNKIPFIQSRASTPLLVTSALIMGIAAWLPSSPLAPALGLTSLPHLYWPLLALTLLCYMVVTQLAKAALARRGWI